MALRNVFVAVEKERKSAKPVTCGAIGNIDNNIKASSNLFEMNINLISQFNFSEDINSAPELSSSESDLNISLIQLHMLTYVSNYLKLQVSPIREDMNSFEVN